MKSLEKNRVTFIVSWTKVARASGYELYISTNKKFKKAKKTKAKKNSFTIKIKLNDVYYVRVRAYAKKYGKVFYGKWSNVLRRKRRR